MSLSSVSLLLPVVVVAETVDVFAFFMAFFCFGGMPGPERKNGMRSKASPESPPVPQGPPVPQVGFSSGPPQRLDQYVTLRDSQGAN